MCEPKARQKTRSFVLSFCCNKCMGQSTVFCLVFLSYQISGTRFSILFGLFVVTNVWAKSTAKNSVFCSDFLSLQMYGTKHSHLYGLFVVTNVWDKAPSFVWYFCCNKCMGKRHDKRLGPLLYFFWPDAFFNKQICSKNLFLLLGT
jgi:hypothetical protein